MFDKDNRLMCRIALSRHLAFRDSSSPLRGSLRLPPGPGRVSLSAQLLKRTEGRHAALLTYIFFSPGFWSARPLDLQRHVFSLTEITILAPVGAPRLQNVDSGAEYLTVPFQLLKDTLVRGASVSGEKAFLDKNGDKGPRLHFIHCCFRIFFFCRSAVDQMFPGWPEVKATLEKWMQLQSQQLFNSPLYYLSNDKDSKRRNKQVLLSLNLYDCKSI